MPQLFENKSILLRGQGGIGKTAMAAQLAYRWRLRHGDVPVFFFDETNARLPDIIKRLLAAFPRKAKGEVPGRKALQKELDESSLEEKAEVFREELPKLGHPLLIFDNLESFQEGIGGKFAEAHQEFEAFLNALTHQKDFPIIFTARYPLAGISVDFDHSLRQASSTDYWKKCQQLSFYEVRWDLFKQATTSLQKTHSFKDLVDLLYQVLGGNYRALEFFDSLYQQKKEEIRSTLLRLEEAVPRIELALKKGMREGETMGVNLVFKDLLNSLTEEARYFLYLLTNFNIPVRSHALDLQNPPYSPDSYLPNSKPSPW